MEVISNIEAEFIRSALDHTGLRIDGRSLQQFRKVGILFHQYAGYCEVSIGDTLIFAAIEAKINTPYPDRPHEGFLNFTVDFLPMAHPRFESLLGSRLSHKGKRIRNEVSVEIERVLEKAIKKSKAINTESLSIKSDLYVWDLNVNLHILSDHGNLVDACVLAAVISLLHMKLPIVTVNADNQLHFSDGYKKLSMHFLPISITLGIIGSHFVLDPHIKEETILDGKILVCANVFEDILAIQKSKIASISQEVLIQVIDLVITKVKEITELIRTEVSKHQDLPSNISQETLNIESAHRLIDSIMD